MKHTYKRHRLPFSTRVAYGLYQILFHVFIPVAFFIALWRSIKEPAHLKHLHHRLGLGPTGPKGAVWIYAASLGEMNAARPLVQEFIDNGHDVLLAHLSPAGLEAGLAQFGDEPRVTHRYMPLDSLFLVQLFLRRARPSCGIVLEIEIWPAMLIEADRLAVPMYMANANLLPTRMHRLKSWKRHGLFMYRLFDHLYTRASDYVDRYETVGVQRDDVTITGELRFDTPRDVQALELGRNLRNEWSKSNFVFMIASSIQGEEADLLTGCQNLLRSAPNVRIIWVPRSPQRFNAVAEMARSKGIQVAQRSQLDGSIPKDAQMFVGDTLGEMDMYLGMADIVFVGASFVNHGGHNIIEPLTAGCPVLMGPSTYGVDFIAGPASDMGVFSKFDQATDMFDYIAKLAASPDQLATLKSAIAKFSKVHVKVAKRCYDGIVNHR